MGQVVPFIARVRESGDWSASERARLETLADQLSAQGVDVEVIFGATDEGDPWCVVTDGNGDVLIHVARIDGKFVVHSAVDDTVDESFDLHAALRERLSVTEDAVAPKSATILPFTAREGQSFLALVVAAAFFYETAGVFDEAQAAEPPKAPTHVDEPPPPPAAHDAPAQEREIVAQGVVQKDPQAVAPATVATAAPSDEPAGKPDLEQARALPPQVETAPAQAHVEVQVPAAKADEAPTVIQGTPTNDLLVGTAASERIEGGAGDDTIRGGGGHDTLLGGAGDDRIEFTDGAQVEGGSGADTFVVGAATQGAGGPNVFLGYIRDFSLDDGDRIFTAAGRVVHVSPDHPNDKIAPPTGSDHGGDPPAPPPPGDGDFGVTTTQPFTPPTLGPTLTRPSRVDVDLDGDGVVDGYLLVSHRGSAAAPPPHDDAPVVATVGHSLLPADPFG